jgi:DNA-binding CsgD family transcriptional regulator/tetratricopeptide (TPR) repeat protein
MHGLPGALGVTSTFPFVGRSAELERLRTLLPRADGERSRVVVLGGEAGSGKSRLVREFAAGAAADGVRVLYGACDSVLRTPYGPFAEALEQLVRALPPEELRTALGVSGGELTRLLPDLGARAGGLAPPHEADPDTERHRLHTAVAELLAGVTRSCPALLVLEDLHWADGATLLLLRQLARAGDGRLLLLGTFRDAEADVPAALAECLADLRRYDVVRLRLGGLSDSEVAEFVRRAAGIDGPPALAQALHALTEGNAFLLCEQWRALIETGAVELAGSELRVHRAPWELGSPESVREVVSQRLARLAPRTTDLLELAATAGTEVDLDVVRRAAGLGDAELLEALEEAYASGMIDQIAGHGRGWRFAHELVRRALYDRLSGPRRAELHLRVGEALEAGGARSRRALADLAHHFAAAAPFGPTERAVAYNLEAARAAGSALAFDEAAARLRTALELGADERPEVFLELGFASHRAGAALAATEAFTRAAALAREGGDAALLARAAIGHEEACWRPGITDRGAVALLEEAATALGPNDSALRVGLLAGLARALDLQGHRDRGSIARRSAIAMARDIDDRAGLATVLMRSYWSYGATPVEDILAMLTEAVALGEELGDTEIRAEAMAWRVPALVSLCDHASARRAIPPLREVAERTAQPFMLHVAEHYASAVALCDGRLDAAEAHAQRSHEWSRLLTGRDPSGVYGIQMFSVRRERGRLAELAPVVRVLAADPERSGPWRPGLVAVLAELGMEDEARRELHRLVADGLDPLRATLWLTTLVFLTDAAAALGDTAAAELVYPELEPFAGSNVMIGHLVSCYGAADRYLGMLAAVLGEDARAEAHFESALALNRDMGADTWLAHTAYEYGRFLLARRERERAQPLLAEASALAGRIGMPTLLARVRALGAPPGAALPDGLSPREAQILNLVAEGLSNRQLGSRLSISEHTAANHVRNILRKTGCANRTEAATYAHRTGLT